MLGMFYRSLMPLMVEHGMFVFNIPSKKLLRRKGLGMLGMFSGPPRVRKVEEIILYRGGYFLLPEHPDIPFRI